MNRSQSGLESHLTKAKAPQRQSYVIGCQYMYFKTQSPGIQLLREIKKNLSVWKLVTSQRKHAGTLQGQSKKAAPRELRSTGFLWHLVLSQVGIWGGVFIFLFSVSSSVAASQGDATRSNAQDFLWRQRLCSLARSALQRKMLSLPVSSAAERG